MLRKDRGKLGGICSVGISRGFGQKRGISTVGVEF